MLNKLKASGQEFFQKWIQFRRYLGVLFLVRFSLLMVAIGVAFIFIDQGKEVLIAMADESFTEPRVLWRKTSFVVVTMFCGFSAWYTARVMLWFRFKSPASDATCCPEFKKHMPRWLGAIFMLLVAASLVKADWRNWMISLILIAVAALFILFVYNRRRWFRGFLGLNVLPPKGADLQSVGQLPFVTKCILIGLLFLNLVFMVVCTYGYGWIGPLLGAATVVLLAMSLMIPVGTAFVYFGNRFQVPMIGFIFVLAAISSYFNDNHRIRQIADMRTYESVKTAIVRASLEKQNNTTTPRPLSKYERLGEYFSEWLKDLKTLHAGKPVPVVLVAAEGGGIRAAYWTAAVLSHLQDKAEKQGVDFARHLFAVSGVSGGSLGAAVFTSLKQTAYQKDKAETDTKCDDNTDGRYLCRATRILARDFLSPTITAFVFPDLLQRFIPWAMFDDRALALERSWEQAWQQYETGDRFANTFEGLWAEDKFLAPLLFLNGTVVETGQRIIVSPIGFNADNFKRTFHEAYDAAEVIGSQIPLSTAVHMSARFTYVSPAGTIERQDANRSPDELDWIRVVDGGYFENSGAVTLDEILLAINRQALKDGVQIKPLVIHISNDPIKKPEKLKQNAPGKHVLMGELLSPVRAFLHVRPARGFQAREVLRDRVMAPEAKQAGLHIHFRLCDYGVKLPLGWMLSKPTQEDMIFQLKGYPSGVENPGPNANLFNLPNTESVIEWVKGNAVTEAPSLKCWNSKAMEMGSLKEY